MENPNMSSMSCETWLVNRKPMKIEFLRKWWVTCVSKWGTRICSRFTSKSHWLANIHWKSILPNIEFSCSISYGELQYELQSYLNPISGSTTNRNRDSGKTHYERSISTKSSNRVFQASSFRIVLVRFVHTCFHMTIASQASFWERI